MAKLYFAADHAGFDLKQALIAHAQTLGYESEDLGAHELVEGDDYPDFVTPCAMRVAAERDSFGIIIGASGQGEAMCANRVGGVRAAVYYGPEPHPQRDADGHELTLLQSERAHNDANVLSLGARFVSGSDAAEALSVFLSTPFSGEERHKRRLAKF